MVSAREKNREEGTGECVIKEQVCSFRQKHIERFTRMMTLESGPDGGGILWGILGPGSSLQPPLPIQAHLPLYIQLLGSNEIILFVIFSPPIL